MALQRLSLVESAALLRQLLAPMEPSERFLELCYRHSGGNVFDLIEFLRFLIDKRYLVRVEGMWQEPDGFEKLDLPQDLQERILARAESLSPQARLMANLAAVSGGELELGLWRRALEQLGHGVEAFYKGLDELVAKQVIVGSGAELRFAHALHQSAFYKGIEEDERRRLHELYGDLLRESKAPLASIAAHYVAAKTSDKAVEYSLAAAELAEQAQADWLAFGHLRDAVAFLQQRPAAEVEDQLLGIYSRVAGYSSAAWIEAETCLEWMRATIDDLAAKQDWEAYFGIGLGFVVNAAISSHYNEARAMIDEIIANCQVKEGSLQWAVLFGAGVCLVDWYQGYQYDLAEHAQAACEIFNAHETQLDESTWPAYSWAIFWREKARAYLGQPILTENIERNRQLMDEGKSDGAIYWHTLTAVGARAALSGRWDDLLAWMDVASERSQAMGRIYWFECWISHSYLYGALNHGAFEQLEHHIKRLAHSPDPYQVRLSHLFAGMLARERQDFDASEASLLRFQEQEEASPDNSYLEVFLQLGLTYLEAGRDSEARPLIDKGLELSIQGPRRNPFYEMLFLKVRADLQEIETLQNQDLEAALSIARALDNPIQEGLILVSQGFRTDEEEEMKALWQQAQRKFLSISNRYQANKVQRLLDEYFAASPTEQSYRVEGENRAPTEDGEQPIMTLFEDSEPAAEHLQEPNAKPTELTEGTAMETEFEE